MLPKPEKIKKASSSAHQLDLVESISVEEKLRKKRFFLYISLLATIGLSLLFWSYRLITNFLKYSSRLSIPKIEIPTVRINTSPVSPNLSQNIDNQITQLLEQDHGKWNVYVHLLPDGLKNFNWSFNTLKLSDQEINMTIEKLKITNVNKASQIATSLPQGLEIRDILTKDQNHSRIQALVSLPGRQLFFDIGVEGGDLNQFQDTASKLIGSLYWSIIQSLPPVN